MSRRDKRLRKALDAVRESALTLIGVPEPDENVTLKIHLRTMAGESHKAIGRDYGLSSEEVHRLGADVVGIIDYYGYVWERPRAAQPLEPEAEQFLKDVAAGKSPAECVGNLKKNTLERLWNAQ